MSIRLVHGRREYIESHGGFKIWGRKSLPSASVGIFGAVFFITNVPVEPKLSRTWDIVEEPNDLPKKKNSCKSVMQRVSSASARHP